MFVGTTQAEVLVYDLANGECVQSTKYAKGSVSSFFLIDDLGNPVNQTPPSQVNIEQNLQNKTKEKINVQDGRPTPSDSSPISSSPPSSEDPAPSSITSSPAPPSTPGKQSRRSLRNRSMSCMHQTQGLFFMMTFEDGIRIFNPQLSECVTFVQVPLPIIFATIICVDEDHCIACFDSMGNLILYRLMDFTILHQRPQVIQLFGTPLL